MEMEKKEANKKVAVYCRTSTDKQMPLSQLKTMEKFKRRQEFKDKEFVEFIEPDTSGKKKAPLDRKIFKEIYEGCVKGEYSHVLILRVDRLCRNARDFYNIMHEMDKLDVEVIFTDLNLPRNKAITRAIQGIFAVIAELESDLISERVTEGIAAAKNKGKKFGRKPVVLDKYMCRDLIDLLNEKRSKTEIAKLLGISRKQLYSMIKKLEKALDLPLLEAQEVVSVGDKELEMLVKEFNNAV